METKNFGQRVLFNTTPDKVYKALMDSEWHAKFTGAEATIGQKKGSKFRCYGPHIRGKQLLLEPDKMIVQTWHGKDWADGHYSIVTFRLTKKGKKTQLKITHEGIPLSQVSHIRKGWKKMYWDKMKDTFGW